MSLVVEDGTGLANAESYASLAFALAYFTARGNTTWAALSSDTIRENALRVATDYMQAVYSLSWKGYRLLTTQALSWPRTLVELEDLAAPIVSYFSQSQVPVEVQQACCEFALRSTVADLIPDQKRLKHSVKTGPIEVVYEPWSGNLPTYPAVEMKIARYLDMSSFGANSRLIRS